MEFGKLASLAEWIEDNSPERVQCEIIDGRVIVLMMSPSPTHGAVAKRLMRQFEGQDDEIAVLSDTNMDGDGERRIPDLMIVSEEYFQSISGNGKGVPSSEVKAVVEIVSPSNPENDLVAKVQAYPRMGIPMLMVVDPRKREVTVHRDLEDGRYTERRIFKYGAEIHFGLWKIKTVDLPAY